MGAEQMAEVTRTGARARAVKRRQCKGGHPDEGRPTTGATNP